MVEQRTKEEIRESFLKRLNNTPELSLADKLRSRAAEVRQAESHPVREYNLDSKFTRYNIDNFVKLMMDSTMKPRDEEGTLPDKEGKVYTILFKFSDKRCEIVCELFPQPFYIVFSADDFKPEKGEVWEVKEFYNILSIFEKHGETIRFK